VAGVIGRIAGERLPALAIVGAILIIAAGILSEWRPKKARGAAEAKAEAEAVQP
jgi:drug/metabolite transporter (DMT)-like permease